MSVRVLAKVFDDSSEKLARRLILLVLADAASDDGIAWIGQAAIARKAQLTREYVTRCIGELEEAGALEIRKAMRGRRRIAVYRLVLPGLAEPDYDRLPFALKTPFGAIDDVRTSDVVTADDVRNTQTTTLDPRRIPAASPCTGNRKRNQELPSATADGGETGTDLEVVTAQSVVAYFVDSVRERGAPTPPKRVVDQLGAQAKKLLDEGRPLDEIRAGVDRMLELGRMRPDMLPHFMTEAALGRAPRPTPGGGMNADQMLAEAARMARDGE